MKQNPLKNLQVDIPALERTEEGQLRGGFKMINAAEDEDPEANGTCIDNTSCGGNESCKSNQGCNDNVDCTSNTRCQDNVSCGGKTDNR